MADPKTRKGDSMTTSFIGPDGVPDMSGEEVAGLALEGALLRGILTQPPHLWQDMLAAVAAGQWRTRLEVVEDADGPDLIFSSRSRSATAGTRSCGCAARSSACHGSPATTPTCAHFKAKTNP
jgi:hypothetical protein